MTARLRVLIADDQALVRSGLTLVIEAQPDMEVAGEAKDGREALAQCRRLAPDVALLDVRMPGLDGLEVARRLVRDQPATRVVMLTTFDLDSYLYEALKIGVSGFFLKDDPPEQLTAGIRAVVTGAALLAPSLTHRVVESYVRAPPRGVVAPELEELTAREREVLGLIALGLSNGEIAERLVIGEATVKTHVSRVLAKLGLRDRAQAVVAAYETGLVRPGEAPDQVPGGSRG
jgi:DNA-binding NarL/FixJ family response regulator